MPVDSKASVNAALGNCGFQVRDCTLIAIATGAGALTLKELRTGILQIHPGSLYYHFWGGLLQARFEEREYNNDFAGWVRHGLHDAVLAERLALINPTEFAKLEDLRLNLLDIIDERLEESERLPWLVASQPFEFIRSQMVVFDTRTHIGSPEAFPEVLPNLSTGSIFYHFIDSLRRPPLGVDDFSTWLARFEDQYAGLIQRLANIDPYFGTLTELRKRLAEVTADYFMGCGA